MASFEDYGIIIPPGRSGQLSLPCPKCGPERKKKGACSLSVNTVTGQWNCHHPGCDFRGSLDKNTKPDSDGYKTPQQSNFKLPTYEPSYHLTDRAYKYLTEVRKLSEEALRRNYICDEMVWMPQDQKEENCIRFPFIVNGVVINIKSRGAIKSHMKMEGGCERVLYGIDDCVGCKTWIWVEGEYDKLAYETAGYYNVLSPPDGAPDPKSKNYTTKFSFLERHREEIQAAETHILAGDNDLAGRLLRDELARRLGPEKCKTVEWPAGCKDANDVLVKLGAEAIQTATNNAKDYPVAGIFDVDSIEHQIQYLYDHGYNAGCRSEWPAVSKIYRPRPGELTIVTGTPGAGKSEFIDALAITLAKQYGWRFGIFSPENQPLARHFAKLAEKVVGSPFSSRGCQQRMPPMTAGELGFAKNWLRSRVYWILPEEDDVSLKAILEKAKALVFRKGIQGLIIDPWNELDHTRDRNLNETEYISISLTRIRRFARRHNVHVWLVAHPYKLQKVFNKKLGKWAYPECCLYDISGSSHWYNKADCGIVLWRYPDEDKVKFIVEKIRFKEVGRLGWCDLNYVLETGIFLDPTSTKEWEYPMQNEWTEEPFDDDNGDDLEQEAIAIFDATVASKKDFR